MTAAAHRPAVPSAPPAGELRPAVCGCCCELIPAGRLHFLLKDGRIVCGTCLSRPARLGQRVAAPLLDQVVAYGSRGSIEPLLDPAEPRPGIATGITARSSAAGCGSDQAEQSASEGEHRSPSPAVAGGEHA